MKKFKEFKSLNMSCKITNMIIMLKTFKKKDKKFKPDTRDTTYHFTKSTLRSRNPLIKKRSGNEHW